MFLDDYIKDKNKYDKIRKKLLDNGHCIEKYSKFYLDILVSVLLKIVNKIENKNFVLKKNVYIDGLISNLSNRLHLLIEEDISHENFLCNLEEIHKLNSERKLTWFVGYANYLSDFGFYSFDISNYNIFTHNDKNFIGFLYLRSFVDYVIDYRVQNNMEEITEDELNEMADQFIEWYMSEQKTEQFVMKLERK